ncbi:MAG: response regulator [Limisphaerales bacterium]
MFPTLTPGLRKDRASAFFSADQVVPKCQQTPPGVKPAHILVVDDEALLLAMFSELLSRHGHAVTTALTAGEARNLCTESTFDLALVDIQLRDTDGIQLVKLMKDSAPDLRIIVMTGLMDDDAQQRADAAGADGVFHKGNSPALLLVEMDRVLRRNPGENSP